ncbi:MAG TPA: hypothetical protein VKF14_19970, partial [Candidatus Dormibacteraeota bacterium]|nr:hypothetical protein [Candidatus Dormibacteraeota bacterium]
ILPGVDSANPPSSPISPPPVTSYRPEYLPAYLSNGMLGLRVGRIPLLDGLCIVNGLAERDPVEDGEGFARAPYPLWGDVVVSGHGLSWHREQASLVEQAYDFSCGELYTRFRFQPQSSSAQVEVLVFCSRSLPTVVGHEVRVEVDADCDLVITGGLNPAGIAGRWISRRTQTPGTDVPVVDGLMEWETSGGLSTCGAAYVTRFEGAEGVERRVEDVDTRAPLQTSYAFRPPGPRVRDAPALKSALQPPAQRARSNGGALDLSGCDARLRCPAA